MVQRVTTSLMVFTCGIARDVSSHFKLAGNLKRRITNMFGSYLYFVVLFSRGLLISFRLLLPIVT
jgi:hypothetical protein